MSMVMRVSDGRFRRRLVRIMAQLQSGNVAVGNGRGGQLTLWRATMNDLVGMQIDLRGVIERRQRDMRDCSHEGEVMYLLETVSRILSSSRPESDRLRDYMSRQAASMLRMAVTIANMQPANL